MVYEHAQEMLSAAQNGFRFRQQPPKRRAGKLTVSVPKAVGRTVVHPLMAEFFARFPEVDVCLRLEDRYMDLIDDGVDLALRIGVTLARPLRQAADAVSHVICATPEYLRRHGTPENPQALRDRSCISLGETPADSRWKFRRGDKVETQTRGRYAANHTGVRLDAVKHHLGIGSLPLFTAREALANGEIVQVLPEWSLSATTAVTCGCCGRATTCLPECEQ